MPDKKINPRVQYTRNALQNALVELVTEKPLRTITVTDICIRADINRSTFYLHYADMRSLLHEVEENILTRIYRDFERIPVTEEYMVQVILTLKANPRMTQFLRNLMSEEGDPQFVRRIKEMTYTGFQTSWENNNIISNENVGYKKLFYTYLVGGTVATLTAWLEDGITELTAKEVASMLHQLSKTGAKFLNAMEDKTSRGNRKNIDENSTERADNHEISKINIEESD